MGVRARFFFPVLLLMCFSLVAITSPGAAQQEGPPVAAAERAAAPILAQVVMCERLQDTTPVNPGVAFPVSSGQVQCLSVFDPVPQQGYIYHKWYHRDEMSTQMRLKVSPPRWATYSLIRLREADKGPWRVEVTDQNGRTLGVARFSVTD